MNVAATMDSQSIVNLIDVGRLFAGGRLGISIIGSGLKVRLSVFLHKLEQLGSNLVRSRLECRVIRHPLIHHQANRLCALAIVLNHDRRKFGIVQRLFGNNGVQIIVHGMLERIQANAVRVLIRLGIVLELFEPRLVVIGLRNQDETLNADQDLQQCALVGKPSWAGPCTQKAEADLATIIEVGIEADLSLARRQEFDLGSRLRIIAEINIKQEAAIGIWSALGAWNKMER